MRSLAIRDYRLFVIGNLTSNVGLWAQRVALGWLTWELTHSTAWLGAIAVAESLPTLVFALVAGTIVDRVDYFRLLRFTQSLSLLYAVVMAVLVLTGTMTIWLLLALVLVRGSVSAFNRPSRMTAIFSLVGRDLLASAVSLNAVIFNLSRFTGPAVAGVLIATVGIGWTFAAAALMFFVFNVMLRMIRATVEPTPQGDRRSMLSETVEGLRYMATHAGIRVQVVIIVAIGLFAKPLMDLLPGFVGRIFEGGPEQLAMLVSANGIGAMAAAAWMASRGKGVQGMTNLMIAGVLASALFLLLFVAVPVFWVGCIAIGLLGFAFIVQNVTNLTLLQTASEPRMRGRVISNYGLFHQGTPALGTLLMGAVAEHFGLPLPVAAGAALCIVLWYWAWRRRRALAAVLEAEPAPGGAAGDRLRHH